MTEPVRVSVDVGAPVEKAWTVYTEQYGTWYPKDHHLGAQPAQTVVIEPWVGGRWYEKQADGTEPVWGHVLAWEPPGRLVLSWAVGGDWQHDPDPAHHSEIEVTFTPIGTGTRVVLEHRHLDRHGDGTASVRAGVAGEGGFPLYLRRFAAATEGRELD